MEVRFLPGAQMTHQVVLFLNLFISFFLIFLDLKNKINKKNIIIFFLLIIFLNILVRVYLSYSVYLDWSRNDIGKLLLKNFNYFIFYVFSKYFYEFFISIFFGAIFVFLMFIFDIIFKKTIFYEEEFFVIFSAIILASWPFNIFYPLLFFLFVFFIFFVKILIMGNSFVKAKISVRKFHFIFSAFLIIMNLLFANKLIFLKIS